MPLADWTTLSKPRRLAPRAGVAVGGQRHADDPGPQPGQLGGGEPQPVQRSRPVALGEHVGPLDQAPQRVPAAGGFQVQVAAALAVPGVPHHLRVVRLRRGADPEHVGAVLGQGAGADRPGQHPGQVEYPQPVGRLGVAGRGGLGRAVTGLGDGEQGEPRERLGLLVRGPLLRGAHQGAAGAAGHDRLFQLDAVPAAHRAAIASSSAPAGSPSTSSCRSKWCWNSRCRKTCRPSAVARSRSGAAPTPAAAGPRSGSARRAWRPPPRPRPRDGLLQAGPLGHQPGGLGGGGGDDRGAQVAERTASAAPGRRR